MPVPAVPAGTGSECHASSGTSSSEKALPRPVSASPQPEPRPHLAAPSLDSLDNAILQHGLIDKSGLGTSSRKLTSETARGLRLFGLSTVIGARPCSSGHWACLLAAREGVKTHTQSRAHRMRDVASSTAADATKRAAAGHRQTWHEPGAAWHVAVHATPARRIMCMCCAKYGVCMCCCAVLGEPEASLARPPSRLSRTSPCPVSISIPAAARHQPA